MIYLIIGIVLWVVFGIIAFFIEVKQTGRTEFDKDAETELIAAIALGIISIFIVISPFKVLMEYFMRKINSK